MCDKPIRRSDKDIERILRGDEENHRNLELFQQVRDYIRSHPGCNAEDIAVALGVDEGVIMKFIREGRLVRRS